MDENTEQTPPADKATKASRGRDAGSGEMREGKGPYTHPEFPKLSEADLRLRASGFNVRAPMLDMVLNEPFYARILHLLNLRECEDIATAGVRVVDGRFELLYNPLFLAAYDMRRQIGVLCHEALHLALDHCTSRRLDPHLVWNWATDLYINSALPKESLPGCVLLPGKPLNRFGWDKLPPEKRASLERLSTLVESFPPLLASEDYFARLMESEDMKKMAAESMVFVVGGAGDHSGWGDNLSDEQREYFSSMVRHVVREAQRAADGRADGWGSVPQEMKEEIRRLVNGEIDWRRVLRHFVGTRNRADRLSSILRCNRKYPGIHPGVARDHKPKVGVFIDQSGSVGDEELQLCFGELQGLARHVEFVVFHFDTEVDVSSRKVWGGGRISGASRTRCGGTDFEAPTRFVNECKERFEGVIIMTDGCAPKPSPSLVQRCWVVVPEQKLIFEKDQRDVLVSMKRPRGTTGK